MRGGKVGRWGRGMELALEQFSNKRKIKKYIWREVAGGCAGAKRNRKREDTAKGVRVIGEDP